MVHDFFLLLSHTRGWFMDMGVWVYTGGGGQGKTSFASLYLFLTNYSDLKNMPGKILSWMAYQGKLLVKTEQFGFQFF
jgi:hypothetical protein